MSLLLKEVKEAIDARCFESSSGRRDPALGLFSAVLSAPAAARNQLVENVHINAGEHARLNVAVLEPGPRHCKVTLSFFDAKGQRVASRGPVDCPPVRRRRSR
jgi:hypothetical protein